MWLLILQVEPPSGAFHEYIDVLMKEKEKLTKTLERVKVMFDSEVRILILSLLKVIWNNYLHHARHHPGLF